MRELFALVKLREPRRLPCSAILAGYLIRYNARKSEISVSLNTTAEGKALRDDLR
jgi:hypothetical protein